jgi:Uma2 family endonuclease
MTQRMSLIAAPPRSETLITDDGEPLESARHRQQMEILIQSLDWAWTERRDFYAGGNMFLYFSETQARKNDFRGPDVFVVLGTDRHERKAWVVWEEEGKAPDVIIELLSETTEHVDRGEKMRVYAKSLKVGEYFLFDPWSGVLEGYTLDPLRGEYRRKDLDARGRVHCAQLGLWLGKAESVLYDVEVDWLRWMDAAGWVLPVPVESATDAMGRLTTMAERVNFATEQANAAIEQLTAATEQARVEAEGATAAIEHAARLEAELERLRRKSRDE